MFLKFDETKELVRMPPMLEGIAAESSESVETMVSSYKVLMAMKNSSRVAVFDIVMPPIPLVGNKAEDMFAALQRHPSSTPFWNRLASILRKARHSTFVLEVDGASGNDRLFAHLANDERYIIGDTSYEKNICSNHDQHNIDVSHLALLGMSLSTDSFASSLFLRSDGHWRRLINAVVPFVEEELVVTYDQRDVEDGAAYAEAFTNLTFGTSVTCDDRNQRHRPADESSKREVEGALEEFKTFFNTAWWLGVLGHVCREDGSCCPGLTHEDRLPHCRRKAVALIMKAVVRKKPIRAASNKWTKHIPSFDFYVFGKNLNILPRLCKRAMTLLVAVYAAMAAANSPDPGQAVSVSYHAVAGSRLDRLLRMVDDADVGYTQKMLVVVAEPGMMACNLTLSLYI